MELINDTRFAVAPMFWEDPEGKARLSVIVKATLEIVPGKVASIAPEQLPIFDADVPHEVGGAASLRFESDLVPFKPRADVVLVGRAHAPYGRRVARMDVTLAVGWLRKEIRVFGDRTWWFPTRLALVPEMSEPEPFVTMDLVYERAFGGIDSAAARYCEENLVGRGFIGKKSRDSVHGKPLPNLEDPRDLIASWDSRPRPVGFGFYGRGWMPRLRHAGTYDERYYNERAPAPPLDFSYEFHNGAHPDLQVEGYLRGDEEVGLTGVSPESPLRFRLPGVRPRITVARWTVPPDEWIDREAEEGREASIEQVPTVEEAVPAVLDTLVLIPEERRLYLVFRGVCHLNSLDTPGVARVTVSL